MRSFYLILFVFSAITIKAQINLAPNPSFETYSQCPNNQDQLNYAQPWIRPTANTPDYFNACANPTLIGIPSNFLGYQNARTGIAYAGFSPYANCVWNCREYIEVPLTDTLKPNTIYCVSFYLSLADSSYNAIAPIGAYFSPTLVDSQSTIEYLPFTPQISSSLTPLADTMNWMLVSDTFTAVGGELYMIIGCFLRDSQLTISNVRPNPFNYKGSYYYIDDVSVIDCDSLNGIHSPNFYTFSLFPNPSTGNFHLTGNFPADSELHIYDLLGQEIMQPIELPEGNQTIPIELNLAEGIYFYRIISGNEILHSDRLLIIH